MRRLKAPLKQAQSLAAKNIAGILSRPQGSTGAPQDASQDACSTKKGVLDNGDPEQRHGDYSETQKAQKADHDQIQAAVAKRARFESNRANLGNFERAYPVEVETVNIPPPPKVRCHYMRY